MKLTKKFRDEYTKLNIKEPACICKFLTGFCDGTCSISPFIFNDSLLERTIDGGMDVSLEAMESPLLESTPLTPLISGDT
ncbi:hypothetical protein BLA29_003315 [Euroglyphus maynei]|uniref:Uncharacterized protein n=1 Tax=Euroglyphus maynei TaxID=6958 RepID=A0A1Y3B8E3_EURMA|nr:hypothetical protein BLA29_003315 [Euroglyphus maynei]